MRIALVANDFYGDIDSAIWNTVEDRYIYTLGSALVSSGHKVELIIPSVYEEESNGRQVCGMNINYISGYADSWSFSNRVHEFLLDTSCDVVESCQLNSPLIVEQIIGSTPTVVRYSSSFLSMVMSGNYRSGNMARRKLWSRYTSENFMTKHASLVLVDSNSSLSNAYNVVSGNAKIQFVPIGIEKPSEGIEHTRKNISVVMQNFETMCSSNEGFLLVCKLLESVIHQISDGTNTYFICPVSNKFSDDKKVLVENLSRESSWNFIATREGDLEKLYGSSKLTIFLDTFYSFGNCFIEPMKYGCPVCCFELGEPFLKEWPLLRLGSPGLDSANNLSKVIAKINSGDVLCEEEYVKFSKKFYNNNIINLHIDAYELAISESIAGGRVARW